MPNTNLYVSGNQSYVGFVPALNGDSVLFTTPFYNLVNYSQVKLYFNHICKVSNQDLCQIEYRENHQSAVWKPIPVSSYEGNGIYKHMRFHDSSYVEWKNDSLLAVPDNTWWKREVFDISNEVCFANVQFRFKIKKGNTTGTHFSSGWFIDDFIIQASVHPIVPPELSFITTYPDTVFETGPFPFIAKIKSRTLAPLNIPVLKYTSTYNQIVTHDSIVMTAVEGDSIWSATIPQHVYGTEIQYSVFAEDTMGNNDFRQGHFHIKRLPPYVLNSVALHKMDAPDTVEKYNTLMPVLVTIKNKGLNNLQSANIQWSVNGITQTSVNWSGNLPDGFQDQVVIGSYLSGMHGTYDEIWVWVKLPNGVSDSILNDDTLKLKIYNCKELFDGDYIIGQNPLSDFATINLALQSLKNADCIRGDIRFQLASGTYTENIDLTNFANYLNGYSLTLTSLANHKDSVVLNDTAGTLITINNTNNIYINSLTLDVAQRGTYAIEFKGSANNIEIRDCNIYANPTAVTEAYAGIMKSENVNGIANNVRIIHNVFDGGFFNVFIFGGNQNSYANGYKIDDNLCVNAESRGIHLCYFEASSVSNNQIYSRTTKPNNNYFVYNLVLVYGVVDEVIGNKLMIDRPLSTTNTYCLYLWNLNTSVPNRVLVSNNEVRLIDSSSITYGVYTHTAKYDFLHNSFYIHSKVIGGLGLHVYNSTATINNNSIHCIGMSPIDFSSSSVISDYNNLVGTNFQLTQFKASKGTDSNSVSIIPAYINVSNSLELSDYSSFTCPRLPNVIFDINTNYRTSITTMGAYSIPIWEGYNLVMHALVSPSVLEYAACDVPAVSDIRVSVRNNGTELIDFSNTPMQLSVKVNGAVSFQIDTIISSGLLAIGANDTFTVTSMFPTSAIGNYNISVYLTYALDTLHSDDTLYAVYVVSRINLPYDVDFSYNPPELWVTSLSGDIVWEQQSGSGTQPDIAPVFGNGRLVFRGAEETGSLSQAIFKGIDLTSASHPRLGFWYAHDNTFGRDVVVVKLATNDSLSPIILTAVLRYDPSYANPGWKYYEIDLSPYQMENCVSIIFEASGFGTGNQNIDRIRIFGYQDLKLSLLMPDLDSFTNCDLFNKPIQVVLENLSTQQIILPPNTEIKLKINAPQPMNYSIPVNGVLEGNAVDTFLLLDSFDFSLSQSYDLTAYIQSVDSNSINDTDHVIYTLNPDIALDSIGGVDAFHCKQIGETVYVSAFLQNIGNVALNNIPLQITINHTHTIYDTVYTALLPGNSIQYHFTKPYIVPNATQVQPYYHISVKANYPCDAQTLNDEIAFLACVEMDAVFDLRINAINKPQQGHCDKGLTDLYAKIAFINQGEEDLYDVVLCLTIDSAHHIMQTLNDTLSHIMANSTVYYEFSKPYLVPNMKSVEDTYTLSVYFERMDSDTNALNDTLRMQACAVFNDVDVRAYSSINWNMGQNIPNPAWTKTQIPYSIPQEDNVIFSVMSINGQLLYREEIQADAGSHFLEINTQTLSAGIYYYSMEFQGQRIVKKMTIQK
ncbi:MAG: T9SS type A sorting domain-containing protein [Bacteroidales bacterium]|jgi:hypothetical protein